MELVMTSEPRVALGYNGSDAAKHAIAVAGRLLGPRDAIVAHVFVGPSHLTLRPHHEELPEPLEASADEFDAPWRQEAERLAAEGVRLAAKAGFQPRAAVIPRTGKTWQTLAEAAAANGAAMIVVGAHGRFGGPPEALGGVAFGLANNSEGTVLIVPADAPVAPSGPALLCYDGSEHAKRAIAAAAKWLAENEAQLLHLRDTGLLAPHVDGPITGASAEELTHQVTVVERGRPDHVRQDGSRLAARLGLDVDAVTGLCEGALWQGILETAEDNDAAVVVMGSRGLGGVAAMLGSVSHGVLHHSKRAVLLCR